MWSPRRRQVYTQRRHLTTTRCSRLYATFQSTILIHLLQMFLWRIYIYVPFCPLWTSKKPNTAPFTRTKQNQFGNQLKNHVYELVQCKRSFCLVMFTSMTIVRKEGRLNIYLSPGTSHFSCSLTSSSVPQSSLSLSYWLEKWTPIPSSPAPLSRFVRTTSNNTSCPITTGKLTVVVLDQC